MKFHDASKLFPQMQGEDFEALKRDIKAHGQQEPIYRYEGAILDGRNRLRACKELGLDPWIDDLDPKEWPSPIDLVMSENFHRRHLEAHQKGRALRDYALAKGVKRGRGKKGQGVPLLKTVAKDLGVNERTAKRQVKAADDYDGLPKSLKKRVDDGELTPAIASKAVAQVKRERKIDVHPDEELPSDVIKVFDDAAEQRRRTEALFTFLSRTASGFLAHEKMMTKRWSKADRQILCRHLKTIEKQSKKWRTRTCR